MKRIFRKLYFLLVYYLWVKPHINRVDTTQIEGFSLTIPVGVFHPRFFLSSKYFATVIKTFELNKKSVLDVGCGSGILSLVAASRGAAVTGIDINADAVRTMLDNAKRNNLSDSITAFHSDLFSALDASKQFDIMLVNPPFFAKAPSSIPDHAWNAGKEYEYFLRFAEQFSQHLTSDGIVYMVLSTDGDLEKILEIFDKQHIHYKERNRKKILFETFIVYELRG